MRHRCGNKFNTDVHGNKMADIHTETIIRGHLIETRGMNNIVIIETRDIIARVTIATEVTMVVAIATVVGNINIVATIATNIMVTIEMTGGMVVMETETTVTMVGKMIVVPMETGMIIRIVLIRCQD